MEKNSVTLKKSFKPSFLLTKPKYLSETDVKQTMYLHVDSENGKAKEV